MPGRASSFTARASRAPSATAALTSPTVTSSQRQIWVSGSAQLCQPSGTGWAVAGFARSARSRRRSRRARAPAACVESAASAERCGDRVAGERPLGDRQVSAADARRLPRGVHARRRSSAGGRRSRPRASHRRPAAWCSRARAAARAARRSRSRPRACRTPAVAGARAGRRQERSIAATVTERTRSGPSARTTAWPVRYGTRWRASETRVSGRLGELLGHRGDGTRLARVRAGAGPPRRRPPPGCPARSSPSATDSRNGPVPATTTRRPGAT